MEACAFAMLLGSAFTAPFSLPAGRLFLLLSTVALSVHRFRQRQRPTIPAVGLYGLAFIVLAVVVTVFGVNPALGVPKLTKLLWFVAIPVAAMLVDSPRRLRRFLQALALGSGVLCLKFIVEKGYLCLTLPSGPGSLGLMASLVHTGSMTDSQRLMSAIIVTLGFLYLSHRERRRMAWWWILLAAQCMALVLNFKRGSWMVAGMMSAGFIGVKIHWKWLIPLGVLMLTAAMLPPVRERMAALSTEFREEKGGRMSMWLRVTPAIVAEHPWGIGYRSLTNEMMRREYRRVEPRRDHLHSNIAQTLVDVGWLGFGVYLLWMARAVCDAVGFARRAPRASPEEDIQAAMLLLMLVGLLLNGLVEYNFGDGEIVLLYGFIMGCAAAGAARTRLPLPVPSPVGSVARGGGSGAPEAGHPDVV